MIKKYKNIKIQKMSVLIVILMCLSLASACKKENILEEKSGMALGTVITAKAYGDNSKEALDKAFERVDAIESRMSVKLEDSEITYINNNAYKQDVKVSKDLYYVIEKALYYAELSKGAFDPTIGKLIDAWGIGTDSEHILTYEEKEKYKNLYNYKNVVLNSKNETIRFKNSEIKLNLGAIVKGYVADEMKRILIDDYGIKSAMLNLGGNVVAIGDKNGEGNWLVGIQNPKSSEKLSATLKINDKMVVTSGNYERYFEKDGKRYHHIISPFTAMPADEGIISSSIVTDKSIDADALSTATYVMGVDKAKKLIDSLDNVEAVFISDDMAITKTSGMDNYSFEKID